MGERRRGNKFATSLFRWTDSPNRDIVSVDTKSGASPMTDRQDNPMGLDGFEFVELTGPDPDALADLFVKMGFTHVGTHRSKNVRRYAQGDINFLLNMDASGQVADFRKEHGPSANAMAFRVADAAKALIEQGVDVILQHTDSTAPMAEAAAPEGSSAEHGERVRALTAATDNIGVFFGEDIFIAFGSI
eukprot:gene1832-2468_t